MQPGFEEFQNRRSYWVYAFARLKPGVSIEQAQNGASTSVHANRQRRRGAAAEGHERCRRWRGSRRRRSTSSRAGAARARSTRGADAAPAAARRHGARAADRVREHRQPAARARGVARATRWPSGCRSARAAEQLVTQLLDRIVCCSRSSAARQACWWRAGRSTSSHRSFPPNRARPCPSSSTATCCSVRRGC